MTAGIFARVPTVAAIVVVALLATATLTLAATSSAPPAVPTEAEPVELPYLVVPDVRRQAYVFAKGALEQSGFAWKVSGSVQGYAANVVATQSPAPGTRVVANGAPIINLQLARNSSYKQEGLPENQSPFKGRPVKLVVAQNAPKPATPETSSAAPAPDAPAAPTPEVVNPAATPAAKPAKPAAPNAPAPAARKPAFAQPGAPPEPLDEIALPARAKQLAKWVESHKKPTPRAVDHWLYQHNWIVTGAGFGWYGGAAALRTLVELDERVQKLWGVGGKSEAGRASRAREGRSEIAVRFRERLRALRRSERGFTLIESLASMTILMTVMGAMTSLMVSGTNAEVQMNKRFQAQTEARLGLDKLRKDVHCSYTVATSGTSAVISGVTYYPTTTLSMSSSCPTSGGGTTVTWCTVANGTGRYGLWRYLGAACSGGTGRKVADYLTNGVAFSYTAPVALSKELKTLGVLLVVNLTPLKPVRSYDLQDDLVLRNSVRA